MSEIKGSSIKLSPEKTLEIKPIDGKRLKIDTSSVAHLDIKRQDGHIVSISLEGKHDLTLGDKFSIRIGTVISVYEIKYMIVEKEGKSILLFTSLPTKVSKFLLPLLGKSKHQLRHYTYFVNAFLDTNLKHILLLYRFTGTDMYKTFESEMMSDPLFVKHIEHDTFHVMYKFRIPDKFEDDIHNFIDGKYSLFSKKLKQLIRKFYGGDEGSNIMSILNKSEERRKKLEELVGEKLPENSELESKPILKLEIYG
jgi:hypothetical protein